jgi:hypothetical protein
MENARDAAAASDLAQLGAAAREFLQENPPGGVEVPAHPGVRLAAGACDCVVGMFVSVALSCPLFALVAAVVGDPPGGLLGKCIFLTLASLIAAAYTLPEAFGSRTLAKTWFNLRVRAAQPGIAGARSLRWRWLVKASPWLLLAALWAAGAVRVATGEPPNFVDPHWVRDLDAQTPTLVALAAVCLMFAPCFGLARQALYDRAGGALVVRPVPLRQQRGHGFEVIPMAMPASALAPAPAPDVPARPAGLEAPAEDGYLPAADDE